MNDHNAMARLLDAAAFASERHRYCRRKDAEATPYINHPLAVASILAVEGGVDDVEVLMAALLHDTVEDTDTTVYELAERFGDRVALIVAEVTDDKSLAKAERKRLQVANMPGKSRAAKLVKLGDKISNLRDIIAHPPADWSAQRKQDYFHFAAAVVASCREESAALADSFDQLCATGSGSQ